jgi:hypothetical protein
VIVDHPRVHLPPTRRRHEAIFGRRHCINAPMKGREAETKPSLQAMIYTDIAFYNPSSNSPSPAMRGGQAVCKPLTDTKPRNGRNSDAGSRRKTPTKTQSSIILQRASASVQMCIVALHSSATRSRRYPKTTLVKRKCATDL